MKLRSEKKKMETIGDISQDDVDAPRVCSLKLLNMFYILQFRLYPSLT